DKAATSLIRVLDHFAGVEELLVLVSSPDSSDVEKLTAFAERFEGAVGNDPETANLTAGITYRADERTREFFEKVLVPSALFYLDEESFAAAKQRLSHDEMARQFRQNEAMISVPGPAAQ